MEPTHLGLIFFWLDLTWCNPSEPYSSHIEMSLTYLNSWCNQLELTVSKFDSTWPFVGLTQFDMIWMQLDLDWYESDSFQYELNWTQHELDLDWYDSDLTLSNMSSIELNMMWILSILTWPELSLTYAQPKQPTWLEPHPTYPFLVGTHSNRLAYTLALTYEAFLHFDYVNFFFYGNF